MYNEREKGQYEFKLYCKRRAKRGYQSVRQAATGGGDCICQTQTAKTVSRLCTNLFCSFSSKSYLCSIDIFSTNQGKKGDVN